MRWVYGNNPFIGEESQRDFKSGGRMVCVYTAVSGTQERETPNEEHRIRASTKQFSIFNGGGLYPWLSSVVATRQVYNPYGAGTL